jgi:urea transport system permease protein
MAGRGLWRDLAIRENRARGGAAQGPAPRLEGGAELLANGPLDPGRSAWSLRFWLGFAAGAALLVIVVPVLNRALPAGSPLAVPDYLVPLLGKYLCYAMLALSLDLVWGYAGILSLGHGAFFALGGYAMGMYLMRQIGSRGVYRNPVLPDFMVFLNWQELPWFWWGFDHFAYAAAMIVLVPGAFALVFGWLAFRSRVTGVYLSIITQAMTYALWLAFFRNDMGFGGNNGLTDYKDILGFDVHLPGTRLGLYIASAIGLAGAYLLCRFITASKLGRVLLAVRDAESRVRFLGYSVTNAKLFVFTVSAVLAGIAGALYVPQVGIINPSEFSPGNSIEIAIWVSVGGRGTLLGPMLGAGLVNLAKTWLTSALPEIWLFFLGGLFILTTLVFPRGVVGIWALLCRLPVRRAGPPPRAEQPVAAEKQA